MKKLRRRRVTLEDGNTLEMSVAHEDRLSGARGQL